MQHDNAIFKDSFYTAADIGVMAYEAFSEGHFADLAYAEPFYLKDFYTPGKLQA